MLAELYALLLKTGLKVVILTTWVTSSIVYFASYSSFQKGLVGIYSTSVFDLSNVSATQSMKLKNVMGIYK